MYKSDILMAQRQSNNTVSSVCHKALRVLVMLPLFLFVLLNSSAAQSEQWLPWTTRVCEGQVYTAIAADGRTRSQTGIKSQYCRCTAGFTPKREQVCAGQIFTASCQNAAWAHYEQVDFGNKQGVNWTPNRNTVFEGISLTQTSECGITRTVMGTKIAPDTDGDGVPDHLECWLVIYAQVWL